MIVGIGTDLVAIPRMADIWQRHGERLARRILSAQEWPELVASRRPERLLAKRFAAKEALGKALGTGMRHPVVFEAISVTHDLLGAPGLALHAELQAFVQARGITRLHLSLSDEREAALAFVVLEAAG